MQTTCVNFLYEGKISHFLNFLIYNQLVLVRHRSLFLECNRILHEIITMPAQPHVGNVAYSPYYFFVLCLSYCLYKYDNIKLK